MLIEGHGARIQEAQCQNSFTLRYLIVRGEQRSSHVLVTHSESLYSVVKESDIRNFQPEQTL